MRFWSVVLIVLLVLGIVVVGSVWYYIYQTYDLPSFPALAIPTVLAAPTPARSQQPLASGNVTAEGTIAPRRQAALAFKIGGSVLDVPVKEGDLVQPGAILVRLDDTDLRNQVNQAVAAQNVARLELAQLRAGAGSAERQAAQDALAAAQAKYDQAKRSNSTDSALKEAAAAVSQAKSTVARLEPSAEAVAVAQARVDQAQIASDSAKAALEQASLKAPFPATVGQINVNVGDFAGPGTPVVMIGDLTGLRVESNDISDLDIARVKVGQSVNVTLNALPGRTFHGTVTRIAPVASESRGYKVFRVWVDLKEGIESGLRWGMDAKIEVVTR